MMRLPIRGGNWNNGANAGLGTLNLNNSRLNANNNIGFRPASDHARSIGLKGLCQCKFEKDAAASVYTGILNRPVDASPGCIYEQIYDFDNLLRAAYACRKGKTKKLPSLRFFANLEENLVQIQNELMWHEYQISSYKEFFVFEPKRRLIQAPQFRDRVVQRAIYNIVEPLFDKTFIHDSYACRTGKGTHKCADRAQDFVRKVEREHGKAFALKADVRRYFSSVDHHILKTLLSQKIRCQRTLSVLCYIVDCSPADGVGVGIPLGNLTSQIFANIYLNELDRFIKHTLKVKHYTRYMDDIVLVHHDKQQLHYWRTEIERFLHHNLRLQTNNKTQVFPIGVKQGRALDFVGFRIYSSHRLLRKCSVKRMKTKMKKLHQKYAAGEVSFADINPKIQSWLGHASHANTHGLRTAILEKPFRRNP